jgi:hypothetical protein
MRDGYVLNGAMKNYTWTMSHVGRLLGFLAIVIIVQSAPGAAQSRRAPAKKPVPPPPPAAPKTTTPETTCPSRVGMGVKTIRSFCDVPAGRDPSMGVLIKFPPHSGPLTLSFDLHARHTYSEDLTASGKGYARYRAVIGVLSLNGDLIERAAVEGEFRSAKDLYDRIGGGAGPGGVKAVAPVGSESVYVTVPAGIDQVSLLGETFDAITSAGHETVVMPGRPVALVSNILVEYRPAPPPRKR